MTSSAAGEYDVPLLGAVLPADTRAPRTLRHGLVAFAAEHGAGDDVQRRIAIAVTEAAANVVLHAYPGPRTGTVAMAADVLDGALEVVITDEGIGMRPDTHSDGLGLGLSLIVDAADEFSLHPRQPSGTEVWMRFGLQS